MKIKELYIKNFGKFSDKKIVFEDGINLFYGENEAGKTTIHTFIRCMLFGLERGRGRASVNDTFSLYEPWDNPNYYAGTLRFESGGKNFRLERNFDKYSKDASLICEDDGEEFSLEHGDLEMVLGGLSEANYENTIAIAQMQVETNQSLAIELQNYATNYYSTGNSDINLDGALSTLNKKKKEIEKEIREELQKKQQKRTEIEQEASYVWRDIQKLEQDLEALEEQLEGMEAKAEGNQKSEESKWRMSPIWISVMILALVAAFFALQKPWNYLLIVVIVLGEGLVFWNHLKDRRTGKQKKEEVSAEQTRNKLAWQKEHLQTEWKEKQIRYGNLQESIEELEENNEGYRRKEQKRQALEMATERLLSLSKNVHRELGTELNQKASAILSEITNGKYTMLLIDEKLKMHLYTGEKKIDILQVSRGTIEQIYFALRMAASEILHEEEYPIVLDDTFVFYDDIRLKNTLRWLAKSKKQVLLFTCQKREGELLQGMREETAHAIL